MNTRFLLFSLAAVALSACSSLNSLLTFENRARPAPAQVAAVPAPAPQQPAAPSNEWCQQVAVSDRIRAQQAGFDPATLDRMTVLSFRQCVELGGKP